MSLDSSTADPSTAAPAAPRRGVRLQIVRRWAIASLVANIGIVVTGGAVRLTASGLGCPTWPRCTEDSFIPTGQAGIHEAIEFGNRLLTFVLVAIAIGTLVAAWRHRPRTSRLVRPALLLALGIPAQAVIGGISVLTQLNPWVVGGHLLVSMVLIGVAVVLIRRAESPAGLAADTGSGMVSLRGRQRAIPASRPEPTRDGGPTAPVHSLLRSLSLGVLILTGVVVVLGTIVTGSGPHAGDASAPRTGLNLQLMAQAHADAVFLLVGVTVATVIAARALRAPQRVGRAVVIVLGIQIVQGVVGYAQWFSGLPPLLVGIHLLGAGLAVASATDLRIATLEHRVPQPGAGAVAAGGGAVRASGAH